MICRADEHYRVVRGHGSLSIVTALKCMADGCAFVVTRNEVSGAPAPGWDGQTTSGQPRYNRMRATMVKHIHAAHPAKQEKE